MSFHVSVFQPGLKELAKLTEIDIDETGVAGAKDFFEAKVKEVDAINKFEEDIKREQEERKRENEEKKKRLQAFKARMS